MLTHRARRFSADIPRILALVRAVAAVGARHGATPGQVALAWLLAQGDDIIPIPGTRSIAVRHPAHSCSASC